MTRGSLDSGPSSASFAATLGVLLVLASGCASVSDGKHTKGEATLVYEGKQAMQEVYAGFGEGLSSGTKVGRTLVIRTRSAIGEPDLGELHSVWFTATFDRAFNEGTTPVMSSCVAKSQSGSSYQWIDLPCEGEVEVTACLDFKSSDPAVGEEVIDYYLSGRFELTMKRAYTAETWVFRDGRFETVFVKEGSSAFEGWRY
jgi:hypothetical protein